MMKRPILDGSRAQQHVPMGLACRFSESGRNAEHFGAAFGQRSVELRKAQVVAD